MPTRRLCLLTASLALPWATSARASTSPLPAEIRGELGNVRLQGNGQMRFLGLAVYDIRLWAASPLVPDQVSGRALALEIEYARALQGEQIAERSLAEMKRGARIDAATAERWLSTMKRLFPDVGKGDRLTGVQQPDGTARFFVNGRLTGEVRDPAFTTLFFGIWLGRHSSEPDLRDQLLGRAG